MEEGFDLMAPGIEEKNPEDKEPAVLKNTLKDFGVIIGFIFVYIIFYQYVSTGDISNGIDLQNDVNLILSDTQNFSSVSASVSASAPSSSSSSSPSSAPSSSPSSSPSSAPSSSPPPVVTSVPASSPFPVATSVPVESPDPVEPKIHAVRMDVNGFYPDVISINKSDTIIWTNVENQRMRVVLLSKEGLFENNVMIENNRFEYQFNQQGNYSFVLAENPSLIEYPKANGKVIVN